MSPEKYNGWTNRETWALFTHISNTEWLYVDHTERVHLAGSGTRSADDLLDVVEANLREWTGGLWFTVCKGRGEHQELFCSLLEDVGSLWRVNYREVAKALIESTGGVK